jgi:hypothetical protein
VLNVGFFLRKFSGEKLVHFKFFIIILRRASQQKQLESELAASKEEILKLKSKNDVSYFFFINPYLHSVGDP